MKFASSFFFWAALCAPITDASLSTLCCYTPQFFVDNYPWVTGVTDTPLCTEEDQPYAGAMAQVCVTIQDFVTGHVTASQPGWDPYFFIANSQNKCHGFTVNDMGMDKATLCENGVPVAPATYPPDADTEVIGAAIDAQLEMLKNVDDFKCCYYKNAGVDGFLPDDKVMCQATGDIRCVSMYETVNPVQICDEYYSSGFLNPADVPSDSGGPWYSSCQTCHNGGCGGDPHIQTWHGNWFDFHGQCDLVLTRAAAFAKGLGLEIHIRTKIRQQYSYIESAAIQIGNSILEVASFGTYLLDGISQADMPNTISEYPVEYTSNHDKEHVFVIRLDGHQSIILKSFKDMVSVKFQNSTSNDFGGALGLMGEFGTGKFYARNGKTILDDPDVFAQEWQVRDTEPKLFQDQTNIPQYPMQCLLPDTTKATGRRRLGESVARKAAEQACAHWDTPDSRDNCVYDVMATGSTEYAVSVF